MKIWNKETRTEKGIPYRDMDWGVDVPDNFFTDPKVSEKELKNRKDNFTKNKPPDESLIDCIPCDYKSRKWVIDKKEMDDFEDSKNILLTIRDMQTADVNKFVKDTDTKEILRTLLKYIVISENKSGKYSNVHRAVKKI